MHLVYFRADRIRVLAREVAFFRGRRRVKADYGAGQACRPYLSVTDAATNFLRPMDCRERFKVALGKVWRR